MKEELDKEQVRKDLEKMADELKQAVYHITLVYNRLNEIYGDL